MTASCEISKNIFGRYKVRYVCPKCHERLHSPLDDAGKTDNCPDCLTAFTIPGVDDRKRIIAENKTKQREKKLAAERCKKEFKKWITTEIRRINSPNDIGVFDGAAIVVIIGLCIFVPYVIYVSLPSSPPSKSTSYSEMRRQKGYRSAPTAKYTKQEGNKFSTPMGDAILREQYKNDGMSDKHAREAVAITRLLQEAAGEE